MSDQAIGTIARLDADPRRYNIWQDSWKDWLVYRNCEEVGEYKSLPEAMDAAYAHAKNEALKEPS